jgi:hypothetical protein
MPDKICFVIAPIGEEGSDIRRRSDQVLEYILSPIAGDFGYEVIRADKISKPGIITSQVIQHLIEDPLVIADLSFQNPNVFYELAIRHAVKKPFIQLMRIGESIPFDVAPTRVIRFDTSDMGSVENCKKELRNQIAEIEKDPTQVETPVSITIDVMTLRQSEKPFDKVFAELSTLVREELKSQSDVLSRIHERVQRIENTQRIYFPSEIFPHGASWSPSGSASSVSFSPSVSPSVSGSLYGSTTFTCKPSIIEESGGVTLKPIKQDKKSTDEDKSPE